MPYIDGFGRKVPCFTLLGISLVAAVISTCATVAWLYATMLFTVGFTWGPSFQVGYLLIMENVPQSLQAATTVSMNVIYSSVLIVMSLMCCWVTRSWSWRLETLLWYSPLLLIFLVGPFIVSESPISAGATESAKGQTADNSVLVPLQTLFGSRLRRRALLTSLCWTAASVSYFSLSYMAGDLSEDLYLNAVLLALVDIVGYGVPAFLLGRLGCRGTQMFAFSGAAVALLFCAFVPEGPWLVAFALVGRLQVDIAFTTVYLLIVECFAEECRAAATGVANVVANTFNLFAPLTLLVPTAVSSLCLAFLCGGALVATWTLQTEDSPAMATQDKKASES